MLPRVKIDFANGNLGLVSPSPDGLLGLCISGTAVGSTFKLKTAYKLNSYKSLEDLGITEVNNPRIDKVVKDFYNEASDGTEVWLMGFSQSTKVSDIVDKSKDNAGQLIIQAGGKLRGLVVSRKPKDSYSATLQDGMDKDIYTAINNAQQLGEWATDKKFAPVFTILEGYAYSGTATDLKDISDGTEDNRVSVMIGSTEKSDKQAAVGTLAGRIASIPVQRNIARVKTGALFPIETYLGDKKTDVAQVDGDVATLNDKGFITFRTFIGRVGYFFNDDFTATDSTDDYSHLTARRTIDKAYRIAYDQLVESLLDDVPVNEDGTLQTGLIKSWEAEVEGAIATSMTANGELSSDINNPNDQGVKCFIDPTQNIVSTSKVIVNLSVRPFGYPRYIDVNLGFEAVG